MEELQMELYGINKKENTNILIKLVKERELNSWKYGRITICMRKGYEYHVHKMDHKRKGEWEDMKG